MKKLLIALLTLIMVLSMASCDMLPDSIKDQLDAILGNTQETPEHVHEFVFSEKDSKSVGCTKDGLEVRICSCGEKQELVIEKLGHEWKKMSETAATCTTYGKTNYKCTRCSEKNTEKSSPTGHAWGEMVEASRLVACTNPGCSGVKLSESNDTHPEALTFNFTTEHEDAITAKYDEVLAMIEDGDDYDPSLHGYAETGTLKDAFTVVDDAHTELYDLIMYAVSQRQLAEIAYYCDMNNSELEETYTYMMDYYTNIISKFYSLSQPFYDSCYREFYYYGMSEAEINAYLFEANALANEEYAALSERNNAIEAEIIALVNAAGGPVSGDNLPKLYAEFVENNNRMAKLMGYDNYLEYAYENVYGRDYTYQDVAKLTEYVRQYLAPAYISTYSKFLGLKYDQDDVNEYNTQTSVSFFNNLKANTTLNDYIDQMAFTSNPDKMISFSDELNKLMVDGNLFRGDYKGAFVTSITGVDIPIAYFGPGYDNAFTVAHEFGHYMNEIYSGGDVNQSYDLLEMHSQGNELLYLYFIKPYYSTTGYDLIETYQLLVMIDTIMAGLAVDSFEQAVYLNVYEGTYSDVIMADGKITYDEYDLLYKGIIEDFGTSEYQGTDYWRYGMTITSPCYYVSYSVSAISVLQLYEMAHTDGFDVAKEAYLKLFTYVDENPDMTMEEVLEYAGLFSYNDEKLYMTIRSFMAKH